MKDKTYKTSHNIFIHISIAIELIFLMRQGDIQWAIWNEQIHLAIIKIVPDLEICIAAITSCDNFVKHNI